MGTSWGQADKTLVHKQTQYKELHLRVKFFFFLKSLVSERFTLGSFRQAPRAAVLLPAPSMQINAQASTGMKLGTLSSSTIHRGTTTTTLHARSPRNLRCQMPFEGHRPHIYRYQFAGLWLRVARKPVLLSSCVVQETKQCTSFSNCSFFQTCCW